MVEVIRFKRKQPDSMEWSRVDDLKGWHIIQPPCDYTACGHATDEYNIEKKEGKVTCKGCLEIIRFYKELKI